MNKLNKKLYGTKKGHKSIWSDKQAKKLTRGSAVVKRIAGEK